MSKVDEAIVEAAAELERIAPILEGLYDYRRLNIKDSTRGIIEAAIGQYERRKDYLTGFKSSGETLATDGHPLLLIPDVTLTVKADLDEQAATIAAALAQIHSNAAFDLRLSAGEPETK